MASHRCSVRRSALGAFALTLFTTAGVGLVDLAAPHAANASMALTTLTEQTLPLSGPEIQNPGRGLYRWLGNDLAPQPQPSYDAYDRTLFSWRDLEPTEGQYNLNILDTMAQQAKLRGGKYSFRLMTAYQGVLVPDYVKNAMAKGWWTGGNYIPDWNDNFYLTRVEALWKAIGARFGNDPRFDHMDIGMYGMYGEWHVFGLADPSPTGATRITPTNARRLIDAQISAMPNKHWVMLWGNDDIADAVRYAMAKQLPGGPIGIRNDCLGASQMDAMTSAAAWPAMVDRWKTAPVMTEICNIDPSGYSWTAGTWARVLQQTQTFHVSLIGNGNTTQPYGNFSSAEQNNWLLSGKTAGYRYELRNLSVPSVVTPGAPFALNANWANVGVAPTYDNWNVTYALTSSTGTRVWTGLSTARLRGILPTGSGVSAASDSFTLPTSVVAGQYGLSVIVADPTGYYKPLKLAIAGRQSDGSYSLGKVTVGAPATTVPTPPVVSPPPPVVTPPAPPIRIHAGGGALVDSAGQPWLADTDYVAGTGGTYQVSNAISGTSDPDLYRSERWGMPGYAIPVPKGTYHVRLHFAEINPSSGTRTFNVTAENQPWLTNFDIASKVGNYAADVETKDVTVADGTLNLDFSASSNSAKIAGIEVLPVVVSSPSTAPTPIQQRYAALGGSTSVLGAPVGTETDVAGGRGQKYTHGEILWSSGTAAHEVHGGIDAEYAAAGGPSSALKLPSTDESVTPDFIGRYNHFQGGSIYWTPTTHAHLVRGGIRTAWAALGWERSRLGYPTSDETAITGGRQSTFQHGVIRWSSTTKAVTVVYS